jgi:hypothetical protein
VPFPCFLKPSFGCSSLFGTNTNFLFHFLFFFFLEGTSTLLAAARLKCSYRCLVMPCSLAADVAGDTLVLRLSLHSLGVLLEEGEGFGPWGCGGVSDGSSAGGSAATKVSDSKVACMYVSAPARPVAQTSATRDIGGSFLRRR